MNGHWNHSVPARAPGNSILILIRPRILTDIGGIVLVAIIGMLSIVASAQAEPKQPLLVDRWQQLPTFPMFAFPVSSSQAIVLGGTSLPADSNGVQTAATTVELYDYQKGSQRLADAPFAVANAVQLTDGTILICGNYGTPKCAVYKQATNIWQVFDAPPGLGGYPFLIPIHSGSAVLGGGEIGVRAPMFSHLTFRLNLASLTWTRVGDTIGNWAQPGFMITDGRAVLLSGAGLEIFDPATNQWSAGPTIPFGTYFQSVAVPGDRVLTIGIYYQMYDALSQQWTVLGNVPSSLSGGITVLPNGQVLIAGGTNYHVDTPVVLQSTMLFDPSTGTTRAAAPLDVPRDGYATVVVGDGTVLLMGGIIQPFRAPEVLTKSVESFPWEPSFSGPLDPGFYVVTATQRDGSWGGFWEMAVNSSGTLDGGLNVGGFLQSPNVTNGTFVTTEEVGYGAFYTSDPQTVSATVDLQQPSCNCNLVADVRILDSNRQIVAGPVSGDTHIQISQTLQPGFYIVEVHPDPTRTRAAFALAINGSQFQAGGFGGALISRYAGVPGFVSFYLSSRENVSISLLNQNTIGYPRGAGELTMTLKDSSGNTLFQAGPGAMK